MIITTERISHNAQTVLFPSFFKMVSFNFGNGLPVYSLIVTKETSTLITIKPTKIKNDKSSGWGQKSRAPILRSKQILIIDPRKSTRLAAIGVAFS